MTIPNMCGCCGRACPKPKLKMAFVLGKGMQHVCPECMSYGLTVCAPRPNGRIA